MEEKDIDSLYNRGNKSVHLMPAGSFIISQEREIVGGKVRKRERKAAVGKSKNEKKLLD